MENLITIKSVNAVRNLVKGKDIYAFCSEPLPDVKARKIYEPFSYLELHLADVDEKEVAVNFSAKTVLSTVNRESPYLESSVKTACVVTGNADMRNASTQLYKTLKLASPDEARELFLDRIRETVKDKKRKNAQPLTDEKILRYMRIGCMKWV